MPTLPTIFRNARFVRIITLWFMVGVVFVLFPPSDTDLLTPVILLSWLLLGLSVVVAAIKLARHAPTTWRSAVPCLAIVGAISAMWGVGLARPFLFARLELLDFDRSEATLRWFLILHEADFADLSMRLKSDTTLMEVLPQEPWRSLEVPAEGSGASKWSDSAAVLRRLQFRRLSRATPADGVLFEVFGECWPQLGFFLARTPMPLNWELDTDGPPIRVEAHHVTDSWHTYEAIPRS